MLSSHDKLPCEPSSFCLFPFPVHTSPYKASPTTKLWSGLNLQQFYLYSISAEQAEVLAHVTDHRESGGEPEEKTHKRTR